MKRFPVWTAGLLALLIVAPGLSAQQGRQGMGQMPVQFPTDDPVIKLIWEEGMEGSQVYMLSQILNDSLGSRLTASPGYAAAADWVIQQFGRWGISAETEQYGSWKGWRRGISHIDMMAPWVKSLEAMSLAWSPPTNGPVTADVVAMPMMSTEAELDTFLASVRGRFVLTDLPEPTCRPDGNWAEFAQPQTFQMMQDKRSEARTAWGEALEAVGFGGRGSGSAIARRVEEAGAAGVITSSWPGGWGVYRVFGAATKSIPSVAMSCEDYGMLYRLAKHDQGPVVRMDIESEDMGDVPAFNLIATIPGTELPNEYILLSAHFDTWDGSTGAADNGTGTVIMMEAARLLKQFYPNPRRTIVIGLWNSEEQGLNGSRAFAFDHPEVIENLQASFNQDNGTGRIVRISMQGLTEAGAHFGGWFSKIPAQLTQEIDLNIPGSPGGGGSDYASFVCSGAPGFSLSSLGWSYNPYTWHTQRDSFDKLILDEITQNAVLTAMLTYLASEDPERMPRDQRVLGTNPRTGEPRTWPTCRDAARTSEDYFNR